MIKHRIGDIIRSKQYIKNEYQIIDMGKHTDYWYKIEDDEGMVSWIINDEMNAFETIKYAKFKDINEAWDFLINILEDDEEISNYYKIDVGNFGTGEEMEEMLIANELEWEE